MPNGRYDREARAARLRADLFKRRAIVFLALVFGVGGFVLFVAIPVVAPMLGATPGRVDPLIFVVLVAAILIMLGVMSPDQALAFIQGFRIEWKRVRPAPGDEGADESDGGDDDKA